MKKTKEKVREMLSRKPALRDNDYKLQSNVWWLELKDKGHDIYELAVGDFLYMYANGEFTNAESIRRSRAKLQEQEPELRGENYKRRQGVIQDKWREDLGYSKKEIKDKEQQMFIPGLWKK